MPGVVESPSVRCKSCGGPVTRLDTVSAAVACAYCGALHVFAPPGGGRGPAPRSERVTLEPAPEGMRIRYRWLSPARTFMAFFALVLAAPFAASVVGLMTGILPAGLIVLTAVMAAFIVVAAVQFSQRTFVQVQGGEVCVWESPALLSRERCFKAAVIAQLFCSEEMHLQDRHGSRYRLYALSVMLNDGRTIKLMRGLPEAADALFIEEAVEKALGLADRPSGGELPR